MAEKDYVAAQKAVEAIRLAFKRNVKPAAERLRPSNQPKPAEQANTACDCCGTMTGGDQLVKIDSGQMLCISCAAELRGEPVAS